ncbi:ABC transporter permease [Mangrovivirga sp. M17]|uniref:ABC transporter permease n=1 Tax=Mangrovivirga halotolerans TaxID=2993936 RepID=A0ABT3RLD5_9BACT|nr:ABC transporter permease [Mangrovivirga halotolerans]MCX2742616.1 ABC transporter permease [Mangrovivirga halotolerans]
MKKNKMFSFINIFGLAIGFAFSLMIFIWVFNMYSVDKFHSNIDRIYQVLEHHPFNDGTAMTSRSTPGMFAVEFKRDIPGVELAARSTWDYNMVTSFENNTVKQSIRYVDPEFLDIFSFPVWDGTPSLKKSTDAVISKQAAIELFGVENVVGKTFLLDGEDQYTVSAVLEVNKDASSIQFDVLLPMQPYFDQNPWLHKWGNNTLLTYALLDENTDYKDVSSKAKHMVRNHISGTNVEMFLYPFRDVYLKGTFENKKEKGGLISTLNIFIIIAAVLLLIACINFMNLSTAQSMKTAKNTGIRKVIGASRFSLIKNNLATTLIYTVIAILLGLTIVELTLPVFNTISPISINVPYDSPIFWIGTLMILLVTTIVSGIYPAIYLTNFKPVKVLKNEIEKGKSALKFRQVLVVIQFSLSIILIIGTMFTYKQLEFLRNKSIGMDKENVLFYYPGVSLFEKFDTWKTEIESMQGIDVVSRVDENPVRVGSSTGDVIWDGKKPDEINSFKVLKVGYDFENVLGIDIEEGRSFDELFNDSTSYLINDVAAELMGMDNPVGNRLNFRNTEGKIIGVFKDVHTNSLKAEIPPTIITLDTDYVFRAIVRFKEGQEKQALASLSAIHPKYDQVAPFDYQFMDEEYDQLYKNEEILGKLSGVFTFVAIIISCLGLFGLASFSAEQKTKEIGIRKVLGSSIKDIVLNFNMSFVKLVLISAVIAIPVSYFILTDWIGEFAYHITLNFLVFIIGSGIAFIVAISTVTYHALKVASTNPVNALKNE